MSVTWEARELSPVPVNPPALAEAVATHLCDPGRFVTDVIAQCVAALDASLALESPELLADHLRWHVARLRVVAPRMTRAEVVEAVTEAVTRHLGPAEADRVRRHVVAATELAGEDPEPDVGPTLSAPARAYLDHVLRGERDAAVDVVMDELAKGVDPEDILLLILQPVQVEMGRLWQSGRASVAHEHMCTAITNLCMSMLYRRLEPRFDGRGDPRALRGATRLTVVATSVGAEAHEIGIRIVADLLKRDGWRTFFLGAGVPAADLVTLLLEQRADVLAVSATMAGHVPSVRRLIAEVRAEPGCAWVKVVVGGRPFLVAPQLANVVGADAVAGDAPDAVRVCNELVSDQAAAHGPLARPHAAHRSR